VRNAHLISIQCEIQKRNSCLICKACRGCALKLLCLRYQLASCLIYARALLEYVIIIMWLRSVITVLPSVKFAEDKVLTFLFLREKC